MPAKSAPETQSTLFSQKTFCKSTAGSSWYSTKIDTMSSVSAMDRCPARFSVSRISRFILAKSSILFQKWYGYISAFPAISRANSLTMYGSLSFFMKRMIGLLAMMYPTRRPANPKALDMVRTIIRFGYSSVKVIAEFWFGIKSPYASSITTPAPTSRARSRIFSMAYRLITCPVGLFGLSI